MISARAGLNGANWDLRYEAPLQVALKTTPPDNPHIWEEPRFQGQDTRRITHWGITATTGVPMAAPGKIYRCGRCNHVYVDTRDVPMSRCPQCDHFNEAIRR